MQSIRVRSNTSSSSGNVGGREKFYSVRSVVLTVLAVLPSELELLELSRPTRKIPGG